MNKVTPKDFFTWAGAMIALYGSITAFLTLIFEYINKAYPDALDGYVDPYSGTMRFAMASLIVLVPVFLVLMRVIRSDIGTTPEKTELWVRRWALMLTLFLAGSAVVITLITLINTFLGGELSTRFVFKVALVILVAAGIFMHFLAELWGFWNDNKTKVNAVGIAVVVLVIGTIVSGFLVMGSPSYVRKLRIDQQKVSDLQNIQWQIINFYQQKGRLPATMSEAYDQLSGMTVPIAPEGDMYEYATTSNKLGFKLCANFNADSNGSPGDIATAYPMEQNVRSADDAGLPWSHSTGKTCFARTIDPERYPIYKK
ncbi:hypothetical protein EBR66_02985 [bacterium]|nr:hypothetical protein [bacterium]